MFSGIFNYDNPVWRFIGKFFDIFVLNLLWIICSLPLFTIGASTTAVYYVTLRLVRDEEGGTIRSFFKSFRENFRQATVIWLLLLALGIMTGFDIYFFAVLLPVGRRLRVVMIAVLCGFALIELGVLLFVFPLQCRFYNPVKRTLFNALLIAVRHFVWVIVLLVLDVAILLIPFLAVPVLIPFLFLFGFPLMAFANSFVLVGILDKYMPKEEENQDEFNAVP
ncbi:MAG: YesL family protein [Clostridiales bacterium]|nr:YesL family protein [Clostridiales bacterium]